MFISQISLNDQSTLNKFFSRFNELMRITDSSFIKSRENDTDVYDISNKCNISVEILGYKKLENNVSPIWKIKSIQKPF